VDTFIQAYHIANPPGIKSSDANDTTGVSVPPMKESSQQPVRKTVAEYKYVASKNSEVFHTPTCRSAKRILPENMVGYSSREEAINAGKKPCKLCKP
jgi:micrococcal nuclease